MINEMLPTLKGGDPIYNYQIERWLCELKLGKKQIAFAIGFGRDVKGRQECVDSANKICELWNTLAPKPEPCPDCQKPTKAGEKLSEKEIKTWLITRTGVFAGEEFDALCQMALQSLRLEARVRELEGEK